MASGRSAGKQHSRDSSGGSSRRGSRNPDYSAGFPNPDDFCNSFWDEAGYDALTARMRQSARTLEELKAYYKEKAAIEEDYAKRMNKLARVSLGKHEIGNLRQALDRIRTETARIGESHEKLAACIKSRLVSDLKGFDAAREERRKTPQSVLDKAYKEKSRQEALVTKAKDKYKNDCISINGLTAQTSLTQGRDLDKVQLKLEKHEATVQVNKNEYEAYTSALRDTTEKWNMEWKSYCDLCQDLEEERMDFLRISLWDYTNALSAICVADDESYEMIRKALERFQTHLEIAEVSRAVGTGARIRDPPIFVDYGLGHHDEQSKNAYRTANFSRSSARQELVHSGEMLAELTNAVRGGPNGVEPPSPMDEMDARGARSQAGSRKQSQTDLQTLRNQRSSQGDLSEAAAIAQAVRAGTPGPNQPVNSILSAPAAGAPPAHRPTTPAQAFEEAVAAPRNYASPPALPPSLVPPENRAAEPPQPQQRPPSRGAFGSITSAITRRLSRGSISQQSAQHSADPPSQPYSSVAPARTASPAPQAPAESFAPKSSTISAGAFQRSASSNAPPPPSAAPAASNLPPADEDPLQARLRELRSMSGTPRTRSSVPASPASDNMPRATTGELRPGQTAPAQQSYDSRRASMPASRPTSAYGGYGSRGPSPGPDSQRPDYGRSASPAPPSQHLGRAKSPGPQRAPSPGPNGNLYSPPPGQGYGGGARPVSPRPHSMSMGSLPPSGAPQRQGSATSQQGHGMHHSQSYPAQQRGASPAPPSLGIALDRQGQVIEDSMADEYARRQGQPPASYGRGEQPAAHRSAGYRHGAAIYAQQQQQQSSRPSSTQPTEPAPPSSGYYGGPPVPASQPSYRGNSYDNAPPVRQPSAHADPYTLAAPQRRNSAYDPYAQQQQQPPPAAYGQQPNGYGGPPPTNGYGPPVSQQQAYRAPSPAPQQQQPPQAYRAPSPQPQPQPQRGPSPAPAAAQGRGGHPPPTGQYSEGRPILFYVQALYDYAATIDEEFSFQAGDIIAVFQTDPDGWWQGELLDEDRKQIGGNTFPSNFTQLLT